MSNLKNAKDMYDMVLGGKLMTAFEKYYDDNVVMVEASGDVRKGKDANREFEIQWLSSVKEMHGGGVTAITSNEETGHTAVEVWMDVTYQDGTRHKMEEVAVQKWKDGKIVHERFYYNMPG